MANNKKLPSLGNVSVPLRIMHYQGDAPEKFFQSGHCYFKLQDSVADVTDGEGNELGSLGGSFSGHYECNLKKNSLYMIIDVEEMWKAINDVVDSDGAKKVLDNIEEIYKVYWAAHQKEKEELKNIKESMKAAIEEKRKDDEAKKLKDEEDARAKMKQWVEDEIKRSTEKTAKEPRKKKEKKTMWGPKDRGKHAIYKVGRYLVVNDNGWDLKADLSMHDYDYERENIKIPVDIGCGIKAVNDRGEKAWTPDANEDNKVSLVVSSYVGISPGAVHYYAKLKFRMPWLHYLNEEGEIRTTIDSDVSLLRSTTIELTRTIKSWEMREDPERWRGYRLEGEEYESRVNAWYDMESIKKRAQEVFDQVFGEGWVLDTSETENY